MAVLVHVGKKLKITHKKRKPVATIDLNINLKLMSLDDERIENYVRMVYILLMNARQNFLQVHLVQSQKVSNTNVLKRHGTRSL